MDRAVGMPEEAIGPPPGWAPTALEALVAPSILLVAVGSSVLAARARGLFARPFWLDEYHTLFVAGDPSLGHSLSALRQGADFNPPGLFLVLRAYAALTGPLGEVSLRVFAFASVFVGLLGVYALLRRCFEAPVALAGTLATWAHPLLIHQAFDGRFYGPWFAALAWLCVCLDRLGTTRHRVATSVVTAMLAAFVCSIHYFGIISLALVGAGHLAVAPGRPGRLRQTCLALAAGPVTLAILVPIFYSGQRAAISVPTWITPPDLPQLRVFLAGLFPPALLALPAALAAALAMFRRRWPETLRVDLEAPSLGPLAGAMGLALMPAAILAISYLLQPSSVDRYAIAAVLCVGPMVATILERAGRGVSLVACLVLLALATMRLRDEARSDANLEANDAVRAIAAIRADGPGPYSVVLTDRRGLAYQCWRSADAWRDRIFLLDLSAEYQGVDFNFHRLERDVAARLHQLYNAPGVTTPGEVAGTATIYLLTSHSDADRLAGKFPTHRRQDLHADRLVAIKLTAPPDATIPPP